MAHPSTTVVLGRRRLPVTARPVAASESGEILLRYAREHPRIARHMVRLLGYQVDGTDADFVEVGRSLPFLRLVRTTPPSTGPWLELVAGLQAGRGIASSSTCQLSGHREAGPRFGLCDQCWRST
jgi:hypothetical protein